jgi:hypothetical protein
MIPKKNKSYAIACLGPYEYNQYGGLGIFTGKTEGMDSETFYEFKLPDGELAFFEEFEIICENKG